LTAFKAQAGRFLSELDTLLKDVGVPDTDCQAFRLQFSADLEPWLVVQPKFNKV
jgi:hypothetical protein